MSISKPKLPIQTKVVQAIIHSSGRVVNVRTLVKNIRDKATEIIKDIQFYNVTISEIEPIYLNIRIIFCIFLSQMN